MNIELVNNRLRSLETHFGEEGNYWVKELRQIQREEKRFPGLREALGGLGQNKSAST